MIDYEPDVCGCNLLFRLHGSKYLQAVMWGLPSALLTVLLRGLVQEHKSDILGIEEVWRLYSGVLSFLVVFRTTQAVNRFWAGAEYIQQARGECVAAVSNLFAFCCTDKAGAGWPAIGSLEELKDQRDKKKSVDEFKASIVSLVSMFFAQTLQQICTAEEIALEVIGGSEVDQEYIDFLAGTESPSLVVLQWIENMIMDAHEAGLLRATPPLLSRTFHMFSNGMISLKLASMINDIPVPFPYDQVIQGMLVTQTLLFPVVSNLYISNPVWAALMSFIVVATFWKLIYIAREIDHPFGDDPNDLDIAVLQDDLNESLLTLYQDKAQSPPRYKGHLLKSKAVLRYAGDDAIDNKISFGLLGMVSMHSQNRRAQLPTDMLRPTGSRGSSQASALRSSDQVLRPTASFQPGDQLLRPTASFQPGLEPIMSEQSSPGSSMSGAQWRV